MPGKKLFLVIVLISLPFFLLGCELLDEMDLDLSEDFYGMASGAQWLYNENTMMEPGEAPQTTATVTKKVVDVEELLVQDEIQWFFVENVWQDIDEEFEEYSYGIIVERDNNAYYNKGFWYYDNGDIISQPFDEKEFMIKEALGIGEYGFWNHEFIRKNERVTVPAGVFDTWYFKSVETWNGIVRHISEIWFYPYVGIVQEKFTEEWLEDGEWKAFEGGHLELIEFQP